MGKLIAAECFKLRKSVGYKVLLLCALGFGLLSGFMTTFFIQDILPAEIDIGGLINGSLMLSTMMIDPQTNSILLSIFAAVFLCVEFSDRTYGMALYSGASRTRILLSKLVVYLLASLPIIVLGPAGATLIATARNGFGAVPDTLLLLCLRFLLASLAIAGFSAMIAMLVKNTGGTIGANIGIMMGLTVLNAFPKLEPVTRYSFMYQATRIAAGDWLFHAVIAATLAASLVLGLYLFNKAELK
ncbi:MAG: ABC transporter permease [Oscillospiraceae bacterium]|jgi:ABC-type transport system involved in multi-copper enzyme maturation permease subunit|nr:ABC transporter permease [Oscillospiraceae bacterium]